MIEQIPDDLFKESYEEQTKAGIQSRVRVIHEYHEYSPKSVVKESSSLKSGSVI